MADTRQATRTSPRRLTAIGAACAVLWLAISSVFRAEEGLGADITWLVSTVIAVVGLAAFVLAAVIAVRQGRSG